MKIPILVGSALFLLGNNDFHHPRNLVDGFAPSPSIRRKAVSTKYPSSTLFDNSSKNQFSVPDVDFSSVGDLFSNFDVERLVANVKGDGESLGSRGEYYVVAQVALIVCIVVGGIPYAGPLFQFL